MLYRAGSLIRVTLNEPDRLRYRKEADERHREGDAGEEIYVSHRKAGNTRYRVHSHRGDEEADGPRQKTLHRRALRKGGEYRHAEHGDAKKFNGAEHHRDIAQQRRDGKKNDAADRAADK